MKKFNFNLKIIAAACLIIFTITSCIPESETLGDSGQTLVKLYETGFKITALNPVNTSQTMPMFEVRRDIGGTSALNNTTTAILEFDADTSILKEYNTENGTSFIPLPATLHSTTPQLAGGKMNVVFNAGEFAKTVTVTVPNAFNFDFSKQYALAYTLTEVSGEGKQSLAKDSVVIVQIMAKNKYDGVYVVTANTPMLDVVSATLTGNYPFKYKLVTTGEHTCDVLDFDRNTPLHQILSGGTTWSYYGGFCPKLTFSATGNGTITAATNYYGPDYGSNKRNCVIDPSGINKWDAATKTIRLKYIMIQKANTALTDPWYRTFFDEVWTYIGPR